MEPDATCKYLLSSAFMVKELMCWLVADRHGMHALVEALDFATLTRVHEQSVQSSPEPGARSSPYARMLVAYQLGQVAMAQGRVVAERRAGDAGAAGRHLAEFLALFAETDYARPAVRERRDCAPAVERFLDEAGDSPLRGPARALLAAMHAADTGAGLGLRLSEREREILRRLEGQRDKAIAAELGLTPHGVRYHIRGLFTKLEARSRGDAVRRACELGLAHQCATAQPCPGPVQRTGREAVRLGVGAERLVLLVQGA